MFLSRDDPTLREWKVYKDEIKFRYSRAFVVEAARLGDTTSC